ncbi:hypothetical protein Q8F55_008274 [Vanrija albida]|uniref:Large ribosomal subunit protein uL3m n=1 Tax=Vanrija albida TaxID=181172 RepID=A0ABR3PVT3_9TREE
MRSFISSLRTRLPLGVRGLATSAEEAAAAAPAESSTAAAKWTPFTQRTGVIARKRGMTALWDQNGRRWPVTVLQLDNVQVVRHSPPTKDSGTGLHRLQLGASDRPERSTTKALAGHFKKAGVNPKYKLAEFSVTPDAVLPVGAQLSAAHFVPGQYVDVTATSIGKGFQGPMKRHGFAGLKASHGVSVTHRSGGSTGQNQDPGRVIPGKKMAGHMGVEKRTQQNLLVHRVDTALNLVFVRGAVPGVDDAFVNVRDAKKKLTYKSRGNLLGGKDESEWIGEGVTSLPLPGGTVERVKAEGWPEVIEWPGKAGKA